MIASSACDMVPRPATIIGRRDETPGVVTLDIAAPADYPAWRPGQFNMLYVVGIGEVAISISGDPARQEVLTHTIRAVGATTRALTALAEGAALGLRGPFGVGWPLDASKESEVVIMAGGLGLAPLRPLVLHFMKTSAPPRRVLVLYGARDSASALYPDELSDWDEQETWHARITVDHAMQDWTGRVGVVTDLLREFDLDGAKTRAYLCGPEVMMRFGARALEDRGVAASDIFVSLERNMKCALAQCGRCQFGAAFICRDGPVFPYDRVASALSIREL